MIGGFDGKNNLNSVERFDPREGNNCVPMKAMKESRWWAAAAEHKGMIYVTGGWKWNDYLETVEMFAFFRFIYFTFKFTLLTFYLFLLFPIFSIYYNFFEIFVYLQFGKVFLWIKYKIYLYLNMNYHFKQC